MLMMWRVTLILFSYVAVQVTSHDIKVECDEYNGPPDGSELSPSVLADLRLKLMKVGGKNFLNISWAINVDSSNEYLTETRIIVTEEQYHCHYIPTLAKANLSGSQQIWFHYLVRVSYGHILVQAANLPLPPTGSDSAYKIATLKIPRPEPRVTPKRTTVTAREKETESDGADVNFTSKVVGIFGGLACLMLLSFCYILYKSCGDNIATSLGFKRLPTSPTAPVPILVVYPAEDSAFQRAVVALAEFLQWHGGCSVAVDMWQQRKIAELGPMRWLAEKAKSAHRVLIVCPQPSSQPSHSPPNHTFPETSIPAAAQDLYPLILNMVASHAKSASDLAKFWVVQLGERQDKKHSNLAPELRACKTFCLMKDLNKLCRTLHTQDDKKISDLILRPGVAYSENSTEKLREAVEKLGGHQASIFRDTEPLKSVATVI